MWATVPLSLGGSKQFDAGKLLMYPITLRKLFAVDFISELTTLHSVFLVPAVMAMCIGAGLGSGNLSTIADRGGSGSAFWCCIVEMAFDDDWFSSSSQTRTRRNHHCFDWRGCRPGSCRGGPGGADPFQAR